MTGGKNYILRKHREPRIGIVSFPGGDAAAHLRLIGEAEEADGVRVATRGRVVERGLAAAVDLARHLRLSTARAENFEAISYTLKNT